MTVRRCRRPGWTDVDREGTGHVSTVSGAVDPCRRSTVTRYRLQSHTGGPRSVRADRAASVDGRGGDVQPPSRPPRAGAELTVHLCEPRVGLLCWTLTLDGRTVARLQAPSPAVTTPRTRQTARPAVDDPLSPGALGAAGEPMPADLPTTLQVSRGFAGLGLEQRLWAEAAAWGSRPALPADDGSSS